MFRMVHTDLRITSIARPANPFASATLSKDCPDDPKLPDVAVAWKLTNAPSASSGGVAVTWATMGAASGSLTTPT